MRKAFVLLYGPDGKRRLQSDADRTPAAERAAFNQLRGKLPEGVVRAEYHDTDLGGRFLTLLPEVKAAAPAAPPALESKPVPAEGEETGSDKKKKK